MNLKFPIYAASTALAGGLLAAALSSPSHAQAPGEIPLGERVHPESIAATPDGGLLIGSVAQNIVLRVAPGATTAEPWISGLPEGGLVLGVFAAGDTAYVCSNGPFGSGQATLLTYDLATAAQTGSYVFPGGGLCNDIAVAADGTAYVTDTSDTGRVLALAPDATELTEVIADTAIAGIDGIAYIGDVLYANDVQTGAMYRIDPTAGTYATLTTSRPLAGPDGMRTTADGTALVVAENQAGRIALLEIEGDTVTVTDIADGYDTPTGVAVIDDTIYIVEAIFGPLFDPNAPPPPPFFVRVVEMPEEAAQAPVPPAAPAAAAAATPAQDTAALMAALMDEGADNYRRNCQVCHGDQGQGGAGPTLPTSAMVSRAGGLINQILQGSPAHGMPPFNRLSDREIASIATFVRNSWGNSFGIVTEGNVAQTRGPG
ncbi:MAG: c-type cytochrome [Bauldia sp.]